MNRRPSLSDATIIDLSSEPLSGRSQETLTTFASFPHECETVIAAPERIRDQL